MTNIATKNGAVVVKDGKAAEGCNCCGGWYCVKPPCQPRDYVLELSSVQHQFDLGIDFNGSYTLTNIDPASRGVLLFTSAAAAWNPHEDRCIRSGGLAHENIMPPKSCDFYAFSACAWRGLPHPESTAHASLLLYFSGVYQLSCANVFIGIFAGDIPARLADGQTLEGDESQDFGHSSGTLLNISFHWKLS